MVFTVADAFLSIRNSSYNYFTAKPMPRGTPAKAEETKVTTNPDSALL